MRLWQLFYVTFVVVISLQDCTCKTIASIDPEIKAKIDDFIENVYLPMAGVSGLGLSIVRNDGEILYTTGLGLADQEKGIPIGNQTQFLIGSITKSLTASIIVKVLNEKFPELGEAALDTPIRKLIPSANFTLIDRFRSEHGTFRDLLAHRMCFLSDDLQMAAEPFNSTREIVYRQRYAEEICGIRTGFQYNNQMYAVAGELISILADRPYEELVQDLITDIGMDNSTLGKTSDDYSNLEHRAQPYYVMDNVSHPFNPDLLKRLVFTNAAGGLWSTADDMVKYMQFHLNFGKVGNRQVIPEHAMKWLRTPSIAAPVNSFKSSEDEPYVSLLSYALGFMLASYNGWEQVQHSGFYSTYQSLMTLYPTQNLGIFTTSNQGPLRLDWMILHSFIFETLQGSENVPEKITKFIENEQAKQTEEKARQAKLLENFLKEFGTPTKNVINAEEILGTYGSGSSGDISIVEVMNSTRLYIVYGKWAHGWLERYERDDKEEILNFKVIWDTDIVQEHYAAGNRDALNYLRVYNQTLEFVGPNPEVFMSFGKFRLGVSLDKLPPIPWDPESC